MINGSIWNFVFQKPHIVEFCVPKMQSIFLHQKLPSLTVVFDKSTIFVRLTKKHRA